LSIKNISISLFLFFGAGLCEIGGGYLVWLWLRDEMSWILGIIGGFVLFVYGIIQLFNHPISAVLTQRMAESLSL
jgi:small multidrug resistance family-3 protein